MQRDEPFVVKQYLDILEAAGFVIFTTNSDGNFTHVSDAVTHLTGYTPDAVIGKHFTFLIKPEWREQVTKFYINQLRAGQYKTVREFPIITRKGELRWVEQTVIWQSEGHANIFQAIVRDITTRRQDEIRYQALFEQTNDAVFILDLDGNHITANQRAAEMLGYSLDELKHLSYRDTVDPNDLPESETILKRLLSNETPPLYRRKFRRKNGEYFPAEVNVQLVYEESGSPLHIQSVVRDISHRLNAEEALRISEERNRALLFALPDLIFVMKRDGSYVELDRHDVQALDLPPQSAIGSNVRDFGFDEETLKKTFEAIEEAIVTREVQDFFYEAEADEAGDIVSSFEARVVALNEDEVMFIVRDVSDLRHAQTKLSSQVEQLKTLHRIEEELADRLSVEYVSTMALDAAMRLANANAGYIGLIDDELGYIRVMQVFGTFSTELANTNIQTGKGAVSRIIRNHKAELIYDVTKDPDYIPNRVKTKSQITIPLATPNQELIGVLNIESDRYGVFNNETFELLKLLTGRISVAIENSRLYGQIGSQLTQLRTLYERVSNLEQLKTDMIRIASHDLRNPLSTIMGYVELMGWDLSNLEGVDNLTTHLTEIDDAAKRMQKIILDILSLERIEAEAEKTTFLSLNLRELAQEVFQQIQPEATVKSRAMKLTLPENPVLIAGDEPQLTEAINNLITNAIKYTRESGTIKVRLTVGLEDVVFEVEDNGIGIPTEQQHRLFQPFYRAKMRETENIEGTGLGLHLVKNIIERHKGKMHFSSEYGKGSTFGFTLPLIV